MAKRSANYFPQGARLAVRSMTMFGNVEGDAAVYAEFGSPSALGTAIVTAQTINQTTAVTLDTTLTNSETQMTKWGRGVTIVASGAATAVIQVRGRDFLGQYVREDITLNGTTPVPGKKAFRYIDSVTPATATATVTMTITTTNVLGLPFKFHAIELETKNQAVAANAGTFVTGLLNATTSTATTADVRGTYTPVTVLPDGVNTFFLKYFADHLNGHGNAQYYA